jgi:PAS domain-containing protein
MHPIIIILVLIAIIYRSTSLLNIAGIKAGMRNMLYLFQHCPASLLMQARRVMAILNGDFSTKRRDEAGRNVAFFEGIVEQMPEAVIICAGAVIRSSNAACERILGARFMETSIADLLRNKMEGDVEMLIALTEDIQSKPIPLFFKKDETDVVHLKMSLMPMADARIYSTA